VLFIAIYAVLSSFSAHLPPNSDLKRLFNLKDSNTESRLIQWGVALSGYKDHPIFGVGPENYYIIGNKYYNPAIFQYDKSWFDKPHNYLLEILVTDGIFGLLAYLGILFFVYWSFYRGYKAGFLSLFEFCVLACGLFVYQIQNLTVFDTVPASLAFYAFMGFAGYIWVAASPGALAKEKVKSKNNNTGGNIALAASVAGVSLAVMAYVIYAANIVPMEIAKAVNYGAAYSSVDPSSADAYFQRALSLPFNFDLTETANKYADFAGSLSRTATPANQDLADKINAESIAALNQALAVEPYYAITWESLAEVYLFKGVKNGQLVSLDPGAEDAIDHAIALAPKREEAYLTLAQIKAAEGDTAGAETVLKNMIAEFPLDPVVKTQLANLYRIENKPDMAVSLMEQAMDEGYTFSSYSQMQWIVAYYVQNKEFDKAIALQKEAETVEPTNIQVFEDLAVLYADAGQTQTAITLAQNIIQADASTTPEMTQLINSLQQGSSPK
jgi:tetratricopeptide (TPR) repeat protein